MDKIFLGLTPELKTFYSKKLLERLVPALQHAEHGLEEPVPTQPIELNEMAIAVRKWERYFEPDRYPPIPNGAQAFDNGYYHAIITT